MSKFKEGASSRGRIAHLSSLHPANDTRIFLKECTTLANAGFDVTLVARPPRAKFESGPVQYVEFEIPDQRALRMLCGPAKMLRTALAIDADVYHFHDPELLPLGFVLKLLRKRVIYDVHENVPAQMLEKKWLPRTFRRPVSYAMRILHCLANRAFDGIVVARADAAEEFHGSKVALVQNFPLLDEFGSVAKDNGGASGQPFKAVYVGAISEARGIREMIKAIDIVGEKFDIQFELAGPFQTPELRAECESMPGWSHISYYEWVDRDQMSEILGRANVALLIFHPIPNHITSYPNKLFEYMAAGVPIVASNLEYWEQFIDDVGSGVRVDPLDPQAIAKGIEEILVDPSRARAMGESGKEGVHRQFNWDSEAEKLIDLVESIVWKQ